MSLWLKILLGLVGAGLLFVIIILMSIADINNTCVEMEAGVKAQYSQNQNNYDNMWKKFKEATQVTSMYAEDLKKVYDSAIQARYQNSTSVMMNWIKEHNPSFDATLYKQIQAMVEGGRNAFEANQKMLLDKKRQYETYVGVFPNSIIARALGFPRIDLAKYDIVTSEDTSKAFDTKKAEEIKLR